ncbi:MAG: NADH-quinone oxidoreductase subunit N [Promethearchaeota archaeon]
MPEFVGLLPLALVLITAILATSIDLTKKPGASYREISLIITVLGLFQALFLSLLSFPDFLDWDPLFVGKEDTPENSVLVFDNFSHFFALVFLLVGIFIAFSAYHSLDDSSNPGVFYGLLLFSISGMMLVAASTDLITLLLSWELGSIPSYAMVAFKRDSKESNEAAMKFFFMGAFSSALTLFGMSLLYGIAGSTNLYVIVNELGDLGDIDPLSFLALAFITGGFGYKMAVVPFHHWAPDVYQGSNTVVTAFLSAGSKKMGFAALLRIMIIALPVLDNTWSMMFAVLAVFTMTLGNVVALVQEDIKRMLAYSSIAHAGYILIALAVVSSSENAINPDWAYVGALMHVLVHALMKLVAFLTVAAIAGKSLSQKVSDFAGLSKNHPLISLGLTLSFLSLMGIPPLGGFTSKFYLFYSAVDAGLGLLAIIAILNSGISIFYYARVIKLMYWEEPSEEAPITPISWTYSLPLLLGVTGIVAIGLYPQPLINIIVDAISAL